MVYHLPDGTETEDRATARAEWVNGAVRMTRYMYTGRFKIPYEGHTRDECRALEKTAHGAAKLFDEVYS